MKRKILLAFALLLTASVNAQQVTINESNIAEKDNRVTVSFNARIDKVKSNEKLTVTPVLCSGSHRKELSPIVVVGRNKAISEARMGRHDAIRSRHEQIVPYTFTFPYEAWMDNVSLCINRQTESCCTTRELPVYTPVVDKQIHYDVIIKSIELMQPPLSAIEKLDVEAPYLYPMQEYKRVTEEFDAMRAEGALIIYFKQGGSAIDAAFKDNRQSLDQVKRVLDLIEADPQVTLGKIVLAGAASPEGSPTLNYKLSQQRAESLRSYLGINISSKANLFEVINLGEDWTGLRKAVEASDMEYKALVLEIMDNYTVTQGREKKLMDLKWGRPYNYMLEHFFPQLRSAGYIRIYYESKPSPEFEQSNKAINAYNNNEYTHVLSLLEGVKPTAITQQMRGVCYMMLKEYDKAETTLRDALRLGSKEAEKNLEQLAKLRAMMTDK